MVLRQDDPRTFLWTEKYRPRSVAECILPQGLKAAFQSYVDAGKVPNLLLSGSHGVGKTTVAVAMLEELKLEYLLINGSLDRNIDTIRNEILSFASSMSLVGGRKYVILDEADGLNPDPAQKSLRSLIEEYSANCGFILTCNTKNKIIKPLHSRCSIVDFKIPTKEKPVLAAAFMKRAKEVLAAERVECEDKVVAALIMKWFPDWRRVLNEMQRHVVAGKIDSSVLENIKDLSIVELVEKMKAKDYTSVRRWVGENLDAEQHLVFRALYDQAKDLVTPASIPMLVLILGKYQYQAAFSVDPEINLSACLAEIMVDVEFK